MLTLKTNLKREKKIDQSKIPQSFNAIQAELPFFHLGQQAKTKDDSAHKMQTVR